MLAIRFASALLTILISSPHPSLGRLASIPSARFLEAGTCANNEVACDPASEVVDCRGCSNNGSSCSSTNDCKGRATCEDGAVGSCVTGNGGGGGDGTCPDGSSCSTDAECTKKCVGGKNNGNECSVASDCNQGGGVCSSNTCNTGGPGPGPATTSPSKSPTQSSGACGSDPSKTVEITSGSLSQFSNGEFFEFAGSSLDLLKAGSNKQLDIFQSDGYNHPFRLCAGGLVGEDASNTPCDPTVGPCGIVCVGDLISDTERKNPCNSVSMPSGPVWYVCTVDGHQMYNQVY